MTQSAPVQPGEPIAIIGSGCRFPGKVSSPSKLWALLSQPIDVLSEIPPTRFNPHGFYHPDGEYHGHSNVRHSYVLAEDHRAFDADFFNVSAAEASAIDPQQRLLLECVYEALEAGGQRISGLKGSDTAVYVGLMCEEYSDVQLRELNAMPRYFPTGTARSVVSNRISYFFDWRGASMTIDTACSSSLVAVHQAVQVLRSGTSSLAIAAGTNLILGPEPYIAESTFHMLSPQGRSHMWDVRADGYGRGDGVAAVVLKRLSDAIVDGDAIECVIRETGVNQDGHTKGITVPSADAQVALVRDTYRRAGLDLSTAQGRPQFFEAHGTGTLAGDPIEAEAIHSAIGSRIGGDGEEKLLVGSIKSIIGHTEGTAGIAGLMKVSLALQYGVIPPNLLFEKLNPAIEPFYGNLEVPTEAVEWPKIASGDPRRASLNSFGFGGTNAHAIVESYEPAPQLNHIANKEREQQPCFLPFTFSAFTKSSLKGNLKDVIDFLNQSPSLNLNDLAYTLSTRRSTLPFRVAYHGLSAQDLRRRIEASIARSDWEFTAVTRASSGPAQILGIFTGQGAQWAGMGKELIQNSPFVQARLAHLETELAALPQADQPSWSLRAEILADSSMSRLNTAALSQPICTAVQIILVDLLWAAGITFAAVVGHSSGEIAAAYACGVISARDAVVIAYYRGKHLGLAGGASGQAGSMMAVDMSPEDAEELCTLPEFEGRIWVAACNSPTSVTLSGDADAVEEAKTVLDDEGKFARALRVDKAYHSHHMLPCARLYADSLRKASIEVRKPQDDCRWFSSVHHGKLMDGNGDKEELDALYWCSNMTQTVMFSTAVEAAITDPEYKLTMALEVGPHGALRGPAEDTMKAVMKSIPSYGSCLVRNQNGIESFAEALGLVWKNTPEDVLTFEHFHKVVHSQEQSKVALVRNLPTYQWDHDRTFWHESRRSKVLRTRSEPGHPLLGTLSPDSTASDIVWQNVLRLSELPWLTGHQLQGQTVFPAAGYVALALEAGMHLANQQRVELIELLNLSIDKAITFEDEKLGVETMFNLHIEQDAGEQKGRTVVANFRFHSTARDADSASLIATGRIKLLLEDVSASSSSLLPSREAALPNMVDVDENEFYSELRKLGYQYSGSFQALRSMKRKLGHGRGIVAKPLIADMHLSEQKLLVHPGFLDAAFQAIFLAYSWPGDGRLWSLHVPTFISLLRVNPAECRTNLDSRLAFESMVTNDGSVSGQVGICGDVDIYSADGSRGMIQVEGISVVPFAAASAAQDTQMFFDNVFGVAFPDGELAVGGNRAPAAEVELGWVLERISYFYLRRLTLEVTPEEERKTEWYHQKLLAYARHIVDRVNSGKQPYGKREWNDDTAKDLHQLMDAHADKIEVQLMRSVGDNLAAAIRGKTVILQHMLKDGMLNQYYVESLGLRPYTAFLTEVVGQITHRYPHMRILEIGAGTGGATKSIMRKISEAFDEYTFTDISSGFFETAQGFFSEYVERMVFQVLDAEKDIVGQGLQEHSYDLVIASLVLHATKDLQFTLNNVRKLLKPGGYLVMLEVTSNDTMRMSFTMGGLSGWWLGADSGRPWSPCVSSAQWNDLLLQSGFSGVETQTLEVETLARPFSVIVSRATDERISLLIKPTSMISPLSGIKNLLIVTGTTHRNHQLTQPVTHMLKSRCSSIVMVQTLEELNSMSDFPPQLTVLSLIELEQPVFKSLSVESFQGLKTLFSRAQSILWATRGCRQSEPYANMSVGFGRAIMMEMAHIRLQFIDFNVQTKPSAQVLVDELLRLQIVTKLDNEVQDMLWSREPELVIDESGRMLIPRIKPDRRWNDCYNLSHRKISAKISPSEEIVEVVQDGLLSYSLFRHKPFNLNSLSGEDGIRIQVLYITSSALPISSTTALYPCIGLDLERNTPVVAFSDSITSIVEVPRQSIVPYNGRMGTSSADFLNGLAAYIFSSYICNEVESQTTLLLIEPDSGFVTVFKQQAAQKTLNVTCITTSPAVGDSDFVFIHSLASNRAIKQCLPSNVSVVINFASNELGSHSLTDHIKDCLPKSVKVINASAFQPCDNSPILFGNAAINVLKDAVKSVSLMLSTEITLPAHPIIMSAENFVKNPHTWSTVVDWTTTDTVSVPMKPSDSIPLLRGDRTYLLVGLAGAGGLGLSLAEWMVGQGAKYIVLTSRNPKVDPDWIYTYAARGVRIEVIVNDVTDRVSLQTLIANIRLSWPPIVGVANGAMVLHDTALEQMTYDQMMRVLKPKVDGTRFLDEMFHDDPLDFFILFSSLSCVFGNSGQSNYAAANMYMISLAAQRRQRGVAASVIDIGAIMGIGYMAREVSDNVLVQLISAGYRKMSERDFQLAFANAILAGHIGSGQPEELITGLYVAAPEEDFKPAWCDNPRFSHVVRSAASKASHVVDKFAVAVSPKELLKQADTQDQIVLIVQDAVLDKLKLILHLRSDTANDPSFLLEQAADDFGIDSLVAVEIRSWFLRELEVDVPVLKILGGATIAEIVEYAVKKLPPELTPEMGEEGQPAATMNAAAASAAGSSQKSSTSASTSPPSVFATPAPGEATETSSLGPSSQLWQSKPPSPSSSQNTPSLPVVESQTIEKMVPMSFGQSRFWFMSQFVADPTVFNITCSMLITGEVKIQDLAMAVRNLGSRHEALRTCFFNDDKHQSMQGILAKSPLHLETLKPFSQQGIQEQFQMLKEHVYDLRKGETMRIVLLSQSRQQHHLLVGYHHINMDGASLAVLVSDLRRLYAGEKLSPPLLQYPDFSQQQSKRLRNGQWKGEISFWRNEFQDLPDTLPILNISPESSRPRPTLKTYRHLKSEARITTQLASKIRSLCRKLKLTPFHLYCAVFQVALARLAGTEDICIGVADANRTDLGAMESIGMFLNLFPVRLHIPLDQPFTSVIKQTKKKILSALANSAVPFDVILDEVRVKRSPTHSPLFQAFIDYRQVNEKQPFGNGELEGQEYAIGATPYDVMLDIIDNPAGTASVAVMVQEGLYTADNAEMLLQCYFNLVRAFADNCEVPAGEPQMFNTMDIEHALKMGQGQQLDLGDTTMLDEIDEITSHQPDSIALKDGNGCVLSYREMSVISHAIAKAIAELNIVTHSRVAVLQEPTAYWICSMLGIWRAGATYVPLEISQGTERLATIVQDAQLAAILAHDDTLPLVAKVGWNKPDFVINLSSLSIFSHIRVSDLHKPVDKDEAMILYTSGSTNVPKGISLPHRMIINSIKGFLHRWPLGPQTVLQQIALSFDVSWWQALVGLATKGTVVVAVRAARKDPVVLTKLIASDKITMTLAVPSEAVSWLQYGDLAHLRESYWAWHISGGEDFGFNLTKHLQTLAKPTLRVLNVYGPAETIIPHIYEVPIHNLTAADMPVPIGEVMPNYTVYVIDERNHPVPTGVPGQLVISGAGIANGYINNPLLTAERFRVDTLGGPWAVAKGWTRVHYSGDRGYMRASDGLFILQARIAGDTQVKLRGQRIDLREIEAGIVGASSRDIADAVVHMRKSEDGDASSAFLVAHIVLTPDAVSHYGTGTARDEFLKGLVAKLPLPNYMRPSVIVALPSLPLNHHGKVDRRAIADWSLETAGTIRGGQSNESSRGVETENQRKMKEIWLSVLGEAAQTHSVHTASDFFLVGGNSLLLISVQAEIKTRLSLTVPLVQLFQGSTLGQMAVLLSTNDDSTAKTTSTDIDWSDETKIGNDLHQLHSPRSPPWPQDGIVVVLTGASGFLGQDLLRRLAATEHIRTIHCIAVRDPKKLSSITSSKVTIHAGDLTHPHLGLSEETARHIFVHADAIIHNGADVSFLKSYATLRTANLTSTKELVKLALQHGQVKHFHYVSTAGVAALAARELYEEPLGAYPPRGSMDGYVVSKWACENYLENVCSATGLPVTIHRPTAIVGPDAPRLDVMHNVLHFAEQLRCVPEMAALEGWFQFVGVEVVARDMANDAVAGPVTSVGAVQYKNHCGNDDEAVDIHQLGEYLEKKHGVTFTVLQDRGWIERANKAGLAPEVTEYLKSVSVGQRGGSKWVFPRVWQGMRGDHI